MLHAELAVTSELNIGIRDELKKSGSVFYTFKMYYGTIKKTDIANGDGVRVSLFVSGCRRHCKGCFNSQTWDFCYGTPFTDKTEEEILSALEPSYIAGLTILGGEPFEQENQEVLSEFLAKVKNAYPNKTIWCYTGYDYEKDLLQWEREEQTAVVTELLGLIDVLVDGEFVEEKKNLRLAFRGSENQRLIDMKKTRSEGRVVCR